MMVNEYLLLRNVPTAAVASSVPPEPSLMLLIHFAGHPWS